MYTQYVPLTKGFAHGDFLSLLLFTRFVSDIIKYFTMRDTQGLKITGRKSLLLLMYADDLVRFANSPIDVHKKLDILRSYSEESKLIFNTEKISILLSVEYLRVTFPSSDSLKSGSKNINFIHIHINCKYILTNPV